MYLAVHCKDNMATSSVLGPLLSSVDITLITAVAVEPSSLPAKTLTKRYQPYKSQNAGRGEILR